MLKKNKLTLVLSLVFAGISSAESMKRRYLDENTSDNVRPTQIARIIHHLNAAGHPLLEGIERPPVNPTIGVNPIIPIPFNPSIGQNPIVEAEVVRAIGVEATIQEIFGFELQTLIENSIERDRAQFDACCTIDGSRFSPRDFAARRLNLFFQEDDESFTVFEQFMSQQSRPVALKIIKFAIETFKLLVSEDINNGFLSATNRAEALVVLERQEAIQRSMYTRFIEQYPTSEALLASEEIISTQESLQAFKLLITSQVDQLAAFCGELINNSSRENGDFDQAVFIEGFPRVTLFLIQLVLEHDLNIPLCLKFLVYFVEKGPSAEIEELEREFSSPDLITKKTQARQISEALQGLIMQRIDEFCAEITGEQS